jgi:hypothetical protein
MGKREGEIVTFPHRACACKAAEERAAARCQLALEEEQIPALMITLVHDIPTMYGTLEKKVAEDLILDVARQILDRRERAS